MSNEKSNSARINDQFNEVSELTGLVFVFVEPMDTISTGSGKIEANLKLLVEHLKEPRQYDQMGNLKVNGQEWFDRFMKVLPISDLAGEYSEAVVLETAKKAAGIE